MKITFIYGDYKPEYKEQLLSFYKRYGYKDLYTQEYFANDETKRLNEIVIVGPTEPLQGEVDAFQPENVLSLKEALILSSPKQ